MTDMIGQKLGQYEIIALLGKGGMATVYRARQTSVKRDVAIKVINPNLVQDPDFVKRFEREAETIAALDHLHIIKIFDYGQHDDVLYIAMQLLTGGSLVDIVRKGPLPLATISRVLDQIGPALDYAHSLGIIHRDLKPHNVLLDGAGNAFLTDFGIAKIVSETTAMTQTGAVMGTPPYMAPEQWRGEPIDARSDLYALGVMLFEMLAGHLPFVGDTPFAIMHSHVYSPPPSIREFRTDLPAAVDAVLNKALAKDREQRYQLAGDLAVAFTAALNSSIPATAGPTPKPSRRWTGADKAGKAKHLADSGDRDDATLLGDLDTQSAPRPRSRLALGAILALIAVIALAVVIFGLNHSKNQLPDETTLTAPLVAAGNNTGSALATPTNTLTVPPQVAIVPTVTVGPNLETMVAATVAQAVTQTANAIASYTRTPTQTAKPSATATLTATPTPSFTATASASPTKTPTNTTTFTASPTVTSTLTKSVTPSSTATMVPSLTWTPIIPTATVLAQSMSQIVFVSDRSGSDQLYIMNADGSNVRALTNGNGTNSYPACSPDGRQVAFTSDRDGIFAIYVMNIDGTNEHRLTFSKAQDWIPAWSPDAKQIAFTSRRDGLYQIYVIDSDGSNTRRLTHSITDDVWPRWSPDGKSIAFRSSRDGGYKIFVMDADGSNVRRITNRSTRDWLPAWSPDSQHFVFASERDGNSEIYTMDADGSNQRRLTNNSSRDWIPDWSPDGKQIIFTAERDGNSEIYSMNTDGSNQRNLTTNGAKDWLAVWCGP